MKPEMVIAMFIVFTYVWFAFCIRCFQYELALYDSRGIAADSRIQR